MQNQHMYVKNTQNICNNKIKQAIFYLFKREKEIT